MSEDNPPSGENLIPKPVENSVDKPVEKTVENLPETPATPQNTSIGLESSNVPFQAINEEKSSRHQKHGNGEVNKDSLEYAHIDLGTGICTSCEDAAAKETSLKCLCCKSLFHAVCTSAKGDLKGTEIICSKSFFNTYNTYIESQVYKTRHGNFPFVCNPCMTSFEQIKSATQESKVDVIDKRVTTLANSMEEMKSLLNQVINNTKENATKAIDPDHNTEPSSKSQEKPNAWKRSILYTDSLKNENGSNIKQAEVDKILIENAILVDKTHFKKDGSAVFECSTKQDRETLKNKLAQNFPAVTTKEAVDLFPTIAVSFITCKYNADELKEVILKQNADIKIQADSGEHFKILDIRCHKGNDRHFQAVIRVSEKIRNIVKNNRDRVYVGNSACPVFDRFHIQRCNICQRFNHYHKKCKADSPACGYCAQEHESKDCPNKVNTTLRCCANCKDNRFNGVKNSHTAFDSECPSYKAAKDRLKHRFTPQNSKNY
jgi:uncharacterized coiled-coil protein SlyX